MNSRVFSRTFKFAVGLVAIVGTTSFAENASSALESQSCAAPQAGTWVDLSTLNSIKFTKDCKFTFYGAGCSVSGKYVSSPTREGQISLNNIQQPGNYTCLSQGEQACKYLIKGRRLVLNCAPNKAVTLIKQRAVYNEESLTRAPASDNLNSQNDLTLHYLKAQNHGRLKKHLETLSDRLVVEATAALGYNYFHGSRGFKKNYTEALFWNRLAATRGSQSGKTLTGTQYLYGLGTERDLAKAEEFYLLAAKNDDVVPIKALAGMYLMDDKNTAKKEKAIKWLLRATELGDKQAKEFLATLKPEERQNLNNLCAYIAAEEAKKNAEAKVEVVPELTPAEQSEPETNREAANIDPQVLQAANSSEDSVKAFNSLFHVRPYFVVQERQGAVPSVAIGLTPGIAYKQWVLRAHATASMLNIALGSPFAAFETSLMAQYRFDSSFFEAGGGAEFWPEPGGRVPTFSVGYGKDVSHTILGSLLVKNVSFGYSQSFFEDRVHKFYLGVGF